MADPQVLISKFLRDTANRALNRLNGEHDKAIVFCGAALGEKGYSVEAEDNTSLLDGNEAIPLLMEGYAMIAGKSLAAVLDQAYAELEADAEKAEGSIDEKMAASRQAFEAAIRTWLRSALTYAGEGFQENKHGGNIHVAAGSQMVGVFRRVAETPFKFNVAGEDDSD